MKCKTTNYLSAFIMGGVASGLITLLYTPCSGKEFRECVNANLDNYLNKARQKEEEIIFKAKTTADELVTKAIRLSALIEKYAGGICEESLGKIENELINLKAAIKAAADTYRNGAANSPGNKSTADVVEEIFSDFDNVVLPKNYYRK